MDMPLVEFAETLREPIRVVGSPIAIVAWAYCVYCCNVIERRHAPNSGPMSLGIWLFGSLPLDLAPYRRRFFVSTAVFVCAVILSHAVTALAGMP
jgi:hypothetical protein